MAELITSEKIQPCLLDRLTDLDPEKKQDERKDRVVSLSAYRKGFLRDLLWLLSSSRHMDGESLQTYDNVKTSSLNYGIRNLCGRMSESIDSYELEQDISRAIEAFEPRISRDSLEVRMVENVWKRKQNELTLEIRGFLWAQPTPQEMLINTRVDLETGEVVLA